MGYDSPGPSSPTMWAARIRVRRSASLFRSKTLAKLYDRNGSEGGSTPHSLAEQKELERESERTLLRARAYNSLSFLIWQARL